MRVRGCVGAWVCGVRCVGLLVGCVDAGVGVWACVGCGCGVGMGVDVFCVFLLFFFRF